jgi:hypothetical protein
MNLLVDGLVFAVQCLAVLEYIGFGLFSVFVLYTALMVTAGELWASMRRVFKRSERDRDS